MTEMDVSDFSNITPVCPPANDHRMNELLEEVAAGLNMDQVLDLDVPEIMFPGSKPEVAILDL